MQTSELKTAGSHHFMDKYLLVSKLSFVVTAMKGVSCKTPSIVSYVVYPRKFNSLSPYWDLQPAEVIIIKKTNFCDPELWPSSCSRNCLWFPLLKREKPLFFLRVLQIVYLYLSVKKLISNFQWITWFRFLGLQNAVNECLQWLTKSKMCAEVWRTVDGRKTCSPVFQPCTWGMGLSLTYA